MTSAVMHQIAARPVTRLHDEIQIQAVAIPAIHNRAEHSAASTPCSAQHGTDTLALTLQNRPRQQLEHRRFPSLHADTGT